MKKILLFASLALAATMPAAYCTTVTFGAVPTARQVADATNINTIISSPSLVLAGTFANESFTLNSSASLSANVTSVISSGGWHQFALGEAPDVTPLGLNGSGRIGGSVTDNDTGSGPTTADFFNGLPLYLWVFNASTVGAATQMGIFRATTATTAWAFPTNTGFGPNISYSTAPAGASTMVSIGGFGTATSSKLQLTDNFNVTPVPEPSSLAVGLFTVGAAICSRRRRK